jgi:hypothetical protein
MTKAEFISRVKVALKELNADSRLPKKFIFSIGQSKLRILINQESNKLKLTRDNTIHQTLKCLKVKPVPTIDECCGLKSKCEIYRTVDKLPKMFTDEEGVIIKNVLSVDGTTEFVLSTPNSLKRMLGDSSNNKFDKTKYCFYNDGYIYIAKERIKLIKIEAYFEDDVFKYNKECDVCKDCDKECYSYLDSEWKVPKKLEEIVITQTVTELANIYKRLQEDDTVNKNNKK